MCEARSTLFAVIAVCIFMVSGCNQEEPASEDASVGEASVVDESDNGSDRFPDERAAGDADVTDDSNSPSEPVGQSTASIEKGAGVFSARCASCHGARGEGNPGVGRANQPRYLASGEVQSFSDDRLVEIIRDDAGSFGEDHRSLSLTDEQLQDVIAFLRSM